VNITEDKVKAYGLIALGALAVYIVFKAVKTGQAAADSVGQTLSDIAAVPGKIIDAITPTTHLDQNLLPRAGDIAHPVPSQTAADVIQLPPSIGVGDVLIGMDTVNAGRFSASNQTSNLSPNAFMAMSNNGANTVVALNDPVDAGSAF